MSASQSDSVRQDGRQQTVCGRSMGRLACLTILLLAVPLLVALHDAAPALAKLPAPAEPINPPLAPMPVSSHQGLGANATVPSWAAGKSIHFFASPGAGFSLGGLTEPNLEGAGEVGPDLGRRCEEGYCPEPPVLYHEGKGVQHSPAVHVIFWGKNWEKAPGSELRTRLLKLYEGISGSTWQGILTQYFDTTGRVSPTMTVSSYIDTGVAAPSSVNDHALREEVADAVKAKGWTREFSSQFVVIPAPGATYTAYGTFTANTTKGSSTLSSVSSFANVAPGERIAGPGIPGVAEVISINTSEKTATLNEEATATATKVTIETEGFAHGFCGYHGVDGSGSSYTFVAYPGEEPFKKGCISFDSKANADNVTSMIASHEYAESATDPQVEPFANAEWYTSNGYELADICASGDDEITEGSLKGSFVQGLWDDHQSQCSLSDKEPPHVYAVTEPATGLKTHEATLKGTVNPENTETKYYFEYGPTTSYGTKTAEVNIGSGLTNKEAKQTITGLTLEGTYHYRIVATNSSGTTDGEDHTFTLSRWVIQTTPHPTESEASDLRDVFCTSSTACTAVGTSHEGGDKSLAERWNGTEWSIQAVSQPKTEFSELKAVSCSSSTACMAVGNDGYPAGLLTETWNGTEWAIHTAPSPKEGGEMDGVSCTSSTACTAVGTGGSPQTMFAERWNGTEWSLQTTANPTGAKQTRLYSVSCTSSEACTAVGAYANSTGFYGGLVEHWNGKEWSQQEIPNPTGALESYLNGVSCTSATACTAVGLYENSAKAIVPLAEHWNGTGWSIQTTPIPPGANGASEMLSVSCLSATACTAVGDDYITPPGQEGQKSVTLSEFWNGTEWTVQTPGNPENGLNDLAGVSCTSTAPETCIAVGSYQNAGPETMLAESRVAIKPVVESKAATSVGETGATLNGAVNPEGYEAKYYFEYGREKYESTTAEASAGAGTSKLEESKAVTGLKPSTTYVVRIVAKNSGGEAEAETTFSTTGKPTGETTEATSISETEATLNGTVDPRGLETKYYFEYGTTESYGSKTAEVSAGSGTAAVKESKVISGLAPGTFYHFRIVAMNSKGTVDGVDRTLATKSSGSWHLSSEPEQPAELHDSFLESVSCSSATACTAVGNYTAWPETTVQLPLAERWNGTKWTLQAAAHTGYKTTYLNGVACPSATECLAVGFDGTSSRYYALGERWNGSEWSIVATPEPSGATYAYLWNVSCASATYCVALGTYTTSSISEMPFAETWNGTKWTEQTLPVPSGAKKAKLFGVSCVSSSACMAVGSYETSSGTGEAFSDRWNGVEWTVQSMALPSGAKEPHQLSVSCTSASTCVAAVEYDGTGPKMGAQRWNGTAWSVETMPSKSGATAEGMLDISCGASASCNAVGAYDTGEEELTLGQHWNGSEWAIQETPNTAKHHDELTSVSCVSAESCVAVGNGRTTEDEHVALAAIYE